MFRPARYSRGFRITLCALGIPLALTAACDSASESAQGAGPIAALGSGGAAPVSTGGVLAGPPPDMGGPIGGAPVTGGTGEFTPPVTGSGDTDGSANPGAETSSFCAALDVVQRNCHNCHGSERKAGAPMSLVTYEDLTALSVLDPSKSIPTQLTARIHDPSRPMPPAPAVMDDADKATLDAWVAEGAPAGADPTCAGTNVDMSEPVAEVADEWPEDCEEVYQLRTSAANDSTQPYMVEANKESHPQFYFDAPWGDDTVQIIAERPITDNAKVLHHWILYDANTRAFITGWAPGKDKGRGDLPSDVGMYAPKGPRSLNLDLHYYNTGNPQMEPDMSGVELCVTRKLRPKTATVFGRLAALPSIAPYSRADNVGVCNVRTTDEVHFLSNSPHMHKYGTHAKLELDRNGVTTILHDQPFSFDDQTVWPMNDLEIKDGDVLTTTCTYDNPTANRVTFGESSEDEMCFNFVLYYPMGALSCSRL